MGDFRVVLEGTGGHGCQREVKDGGEVVGCRRQTCPDCIAQEFVQKMKEAGHHIRSAEFIHWPGQVGEVKDKIVPREWYVSKWNDKDGNEHSTLGLSGGHRIRSGSF